MNDKNQMLLDEIKIRKYSERILKLFYRNKISLQEGLTICLSLIVYSINAPLQLTYEDRIGALNEFFEAIKENIRK